MKTNTGININHNEKTITLSRKFNKAAGIFGSQEYTIFCQSRETHSDYIIAYPAPIEKKRHKDLTIEFMENQIKQRIEKGEHGNEILDEFNKTRDDFKGLPAYYGKVKSWFLKKYPEYKAKAKVKINNYEKLNSPTENTLNTGVFQSKPSEISQDIEKYNISSESEENVA